MVKKSVKNTPDENMDKDQTIELTERINEMEAKWKRALADYQNLEKRVVADKVRFVKMANVGLIETLLPILDNLKIASKHINDGGLELILKEFENVFMQEGVESIGKEGDEFDPKLMECVEMIEGDENKVVKILAHGYKIDEVLIRPAKVLVGNTSIKKS